MGFISSYCTLKEKTRDKKEADDDEHQKLLSAKGQPNYGDVIIHTPVSKGGSTLLEPVVLLFLLAKTLSDTVITNLLEYRTCRVILELPHDNCTDPISPELEDLLQPTTAHIITGRALLEAFVPSCMAVLIGPWSDANGRKPFLVISLAGISMTYLCWGCLSLLPNLYPHVFLLASLPMSLSGGSCAVYLLTYCYISDVTNENTRSFRMSMLMTAMFVSNLLGTLLAPLLMVTQHILNPYPLIFSLSALLLLISALYTHWYIHESVPVKLVREEVLISFTHVKSLFSACFRRRRGNARSMILLIMAALTLRVFMAEGEQSVLYLSVREMFAWQLPEYSAYYCFNNVVLGFGAMSGVWFTSRVLGLSNALAVTIFFSAGSVRSVMMAIATSGERFYYASVVAIFVAATDPLCHTELSRLVPQQELGKIFAFTSILESFTPMGSAPLYTFVYESTFLWLPGAIFFLSATLSTVAALLIALSVFTLSVYTSVIVGTALGNLLITVQHTHDPYTPIFFLSAFLLLVSSLYTHWSVQESVEPQQEKETGFFLFSHIRHLLSAAAKHRRGSARGMIFLIMGSLTVSVFINEGETATTYLSVREKFSWQLREYSEFNCFAHIMLGLGALIGVWLFSKQMGLPNMFVVTLLFLSRAGRSYLMALANSGYEFYVASSVAVFFAAHSALCRTELSRLVPKHDLGKIFALTAFMESLTPIGSTPLYALLYERTYLVNPGAVFHLSALLSTVGAMMTAFVFFVQRVVKDKCYDTDPPPEQNIQDVD